MRPTRFLPLLAAVGAFAGSAAADPPRASLIVLRAVAVPQFLDPSADCPAGAADEQVVSLDGRPAGSFEFCFATFVGDPSGGDSATGTATFHLAGGTIQTTLQLHETPLPNGVFQIDRGKVVQTSGAYSGRPGILIGGGPIGFDANGTPHPNLVLSIVLER